MYHKSVLAIDIGGGTQDILLFDPNKTIENCIKLVLPSPTQLVRQKINKATAAKRDVFLSGSIMGGGPSTRGVKDHLAAGLKVYATPQAAKTFYDDLNRVTAMGVIITDSQPEHTMLINTSDLDLPRLKQVLSLYHCDLPQTVAVAVQDHGEAVGESNRQVRSRNWADFILTGGNPLQLMYHQQLPAHLTRMQAVQQAYPEAFVMDTGPAAIIGALCDPLVSSRQKNGVTIVNVGNMHTLAFLIKDNRIWGMFEHHTSMLTTAKLQYFITKLQQGQLTQEEVYEDGGHGGTVYSSNLPAQFDFLTVTGPNRQLAEPLNPHFAAPFGDMMLTGCFGLIKAIPK